MPTDPSPAAEPSMADEPLDRVSVAMLIGVGLLFLCKTFLAIDGAFEVDEFDALARGREFLDAPGARLATPHRLLASVVFSAGAATAVGDPVVGLVVNRAIVVAASIALYLAVLRIAGRVFGARAGIHALVGLGAVYVLLDHAHTARTDMLSTTLFGVALALALERRAALRLLAGVALGVAFYLSLKTTLMTAALGAGVLATVGVDRRRGLSDAAWIGGGFVAVHALYGVLRLVFAEPAAGAALAEPLHRMQVYADTGIGISRLGLYVGAMRHNPVFAGVAFAGLGWAWWRWARPARVSSVVDAEVGDRRERLLVLVSVSAYLIAMLAYPHPWPYFLATAVPGLAVFWGGLCGAVHRRLEGEPAGSPLVLAALVALVVVGFVRPADRVRYGLSMDNGYQVAVIDRLEEVVGPDDIYFDGVGLAINRARLGHVWLDLVTLAGYRADPAAVDALIEALADGDTAALVMHWRTEQLPERFQAFRRAYFVQDWGNVFVPGGVVDSGALAASGGEIELPALTAGWYHVRGDDDAWRALTVDGRPLDGPSCSLAAGVHRVGARADVGRVKLLRLPETFEETRAPLEGYKPLFPKERYLLSR